MNHWYTSALTRTISHGDEERLRLHYGAALLQRYVDVALAKGQPPYAFIMHCKDTQSASGRNCVKVGVMPTAALSRQLANADGVRVHGVDTKVKIDNTLPEMSDDVLDLDEPQGNGTDYIYPSTDLKLLRVSAGNQRLSELMSTHTVDANGRIVVKADYRSKSGYVIFRAYTTDRAYAISLSALLRALERKDFYVTTGAAINRDVYHQGEVLLLGSAPSDDEHRVLRSIPHALLTAPEKTMTFPPVFASALALETASNIKAFTDRRDPIHFHGFSREKQPADFVLAYFPARVQPFWLFQRGETDVSYSIPSLYHVNILLAWARGEMQDRSIVLCTPSGERFVYDTPLKPYARSHAEYRGSKTEYDLATYHESVPLLPPSFIKALIQFNTSIETSLAFLFGYSITFELDRVPTPDKFRAMNPTRFQLNDRYWLIYMDDVFHCLQIWDCEATKMFAVTGLETVFKLIEKRMRFDENNLGSDFIRIPLMDVVHTSKIEDIVFGEYAVAKSREGSAIFPHKAPAISNTCARCPELQVLIERSTHLVTEAMGRRNNGEELVDCKIVFVLDNGKTHAIDFSGAMLHTDTTKTIVKHDLEPYGISCRASTQPSISALGVKNAAVRYVAFVLPENRDVVMSVSAQQTSIDIGGGWTLKMSWVATGDMQVLSKITIAHDLKVADPFFTQGLDGFVLGRAVSGNIYGTTRVQPIPPVFRLLYVPNRYHCFVCFNQYGQTYHINTLHNVMRALAGMSFEAENVDLFGLFAQRGHVQIKSITIGGTWSDLEIAATQGEYSSKRPDVALMPSAIFNHLTSHIPTLGRLFKSPTSNTALPVYALQTGNGAKALCYRPTETGASECLAGQTVVTSNRLDVIVREILSGN